MAEQTLQSIAEQWASTMAEQNRAQEKVRLARDESERLFARAETLAKMLSKRVGDNIPLRVFTVADNEVVIVEQTRGVRLAVTEPRDQ